MLQSIYWLLEKSGIYKPFNKEILCYDSFKNTGKYPKGHKF